MKYALFLGCNIPARAEQYGAASRAVLERLGVGLVELKAFNCCGYPLRNVDQRAFVLSSAKNLAIAESEGLDILALCKCCYGSLKKAAHLLDHDLQMKAGVNKTLQKSGLHYEGSVEVKHLLTVLHRDVGLEAVKRSLRRSYKGLKIAAHYGCHALRPSEVTQFDDPVNPSLFDELVNATGAESVDWASKLECCGAPLLGINDDVSKSLTSKKLKDGKEAGSHCLCTACPFCHLQFDAVQKTMASRNGGGEPLPAILYPQLLGLCMGLDEETLGIGKNQIDISHVASYLGSES